MNKCVPHSKLLLFYFTIIVMSVMLQNIWRWANDNAGGLTLLLLIFGVVPFLAWVWQRHLTKHPFEITEAQENYEYQGKRTLWGDTIRIWCINGIWYKDRINLHFKARRKIDLKQINLRFVEKKILEQHKDAPLELISIKEINFPKEQYHSEVTWYDDRRGGKDGIFNPPIKLSKGNVIFLEVYPNINVPENWEGYISLDNSSGDERRTFSRKKIIIKNELI